MTDTPAPHEGATPSQDPTLDEMQDPTLDEMVEFLCGSRTLFGLWFGEKKDNRPYWWRMYLRNAAVNAYGQEREGKVRALVEVSKDAEGALLAAFSELSELANILSREPATSARCYRIAADLRAALKAMEG